MDIEVKFSETGLTIEYRLTKPYGVPDVSGSDGVSYANIDCLPPLSEEMPNGGYDWDIFIPKLNRTIFARFSSYQERSMGPNEEDYHGLHKK